MLFYFLGINVANKEIQNFEAMTQMLEEQNRRLRELEMRLQREKQEKANLEVDFNHLLDQLSGLAVLSVRDERAVVCG